MNNNAAGILLVALGVALAACSDTSPVNDIAVRVALTPSEDTVYVGQVSTKLVAKVFNAKDEQITAAPLVWRSDQPFIAAVDSLTGAVTGVQAGLAAITAKSGSVADTAQILVVNALQLHLPMDTILLAPGDTFTIPVDLLSLDGSPPPVVFSGGVDSVATIDPASGLVTAVGAGTLAFRADADTVFATGFVAVLVVPDTLVGLVVAHFQGALDQEVTWNARAFNHPTDIGGTLFQVAARSPTRVETLALIMQDSLVATGTRAINYLPASGIGSGTNAICRPTTSFAWYRNTLNLVDALSLDGGSVGITSDTPIPGGRAISGRFDVTLQETDVAGDAGKTRVRGTFVLPLITLASCP